jgi:hypothetical protein
MAGPLVAINDTSVTWFSEDTVQRDTIYRYAVATVADTNVKSGFHHNTIINPRAGVVLTALHNTPTLHAGASVVARFDYLPEDQVRKIAQELGVSRCKEGPMISKFHAW